jgi:transglutaminase-like putative cysteine protease
MLLRATCELSFEIEVPTPFVLMLRPRSGAQQWVAREVYALTPSIPAVEFTDRNGNLCQRLIASPGDFRVHTSADVLTSDVFDEDPYAPFVEIQYLPDSVLEFLLPSRYCETDRLGDTAKAIVGDLPPGYAQIAAITEWVRRSIRYNTASSPVPVSALEAMNRGEGVCRDIAHLAIALSRALCIPARYVVGYLHGLEPMDAHAWFEAYLGGRWYTFDPTQVSLRGGRIAIAYGRDATDVALYNQYGPLVLPYYMNVEVKALTETD